MKYWIYTISQTITGLFLYACPFDNNIKLAQEEIANEIICKARLEIAAYCYNLSKDSNSKHEAIFWFEKAGELGNIYGLYKAAQLYAQDKVSNDNLDKAICLYYKAASLEKFTNELNDDNKFFQLKSEQQYKYLTAEKCIQNYNYVEAFNILNQILEMQVYADVKSYGDTKYQLGLMYLLGLGIKKDHFKAENLLKEAAEEGSLKAAQVLKSRQLTK